RHDDQELGRLRDEAGRRVRDEAGGPGDGDRDEGADEPGELAPRRSGRLAVLLASVDRGEDEQDGNEERRPGELDDRREEPRLVTEGVAGGDRRSGVVHRGAGPNRVGDRRQVEGVAHDGVDYKRDQVEREDRRDCVGRLLFFRPNDGGGGGYGACAAYGGADG